jgi:hypothetical protein
MALPLQLLAPSPESLALQQQLAGPQPLPTGTGGAPFNTTPDQLAALPDTRTTQKPNAAMALLDRSDDRGGFNDVPDMSDMNMMGGSGSDLIRRKGIASKAMDALNAATGPITVGDYRIPNPASLLKSTGQLIYDHFNPAQKGTMQVGFVSDPQMTEKLLSMGNSWPTSGMQGANDYASYAPIIDATNPPSNPMDPWAGNYTPVIDAMSGYGGHGKQIAMGPEDFQNVPQGLWDEVYGADEQGGGWEDPAGPDHPDYL